MDKVESVGGSIANFPDAFIFKYRFLSQSSDIRAFVRNLDFNDFKVDSRVRYHGDQAVIKAHTSGKNVWIWLSPPFPYSWVSLVIGRNEEEIFSGLSFKKSANVPPHKAVALVRCFVPQPLPHLTGKLRWRAPPLTLGTKFTLSGNTGYRITDFEGELKFARAAYQARAVWHRLPTGVRTGASFRLRRPDLEFAALWSDSQLRLSGEFALGALWRAGFHLFPRQLLRTSFGVQRRTLWGYGKLAVNFERATISAKLKKITPDQELSLVITRHRYGLGDWHFAFSLCRVADPPPPPFTRPNPHVPFR